MISWSLLCIQTNLLWCRDKITDNLCSICVHLLCFVLLLHSLREEEEDEQLNNMMKNFSKCLHQSPTHLSIHTPTSTYTPSLFISSHNPTVPATKLVYKLSNWAFPSWMSLIELEFSLRFMEVYVCMCECTAFWVPLADVFHHIWSNDH